MSVTFLNPPIAYGQSQSLIEVSPMTKQIIGVPTQSMRGVLGQLVINTLTLDVYMLTAVVSGNSVWTLLAGGGGTFNSLTVTTFITAGTTIHAGTDITAGDSISAGTDVTAGGSISGNSITSTTSIDAGTTIDATGVISSDSNILAGGDVDADGSVSAGVDVLATRDITSGRNIRSGAALSSVGNGTIGGSLTVGTGINLSSGNVLVTLGSVLVPAGGMSVLGTISGGLLSSNGKVIVGGALGTVPPGTIGLTNTLVTSQSTGSLGILSTTGNAGNNAGFITISIGGIPAYLPYYTNIAP
jgi:hypothetical protein